MFLFETTPNQKFPTELDQKSFLVQVIANLETLLSNYIGIPVLIAEH